MLGTYGQDGDMGEGGEVESTPHFQFLGCKAVRVMMPGVLQGGGLGRKSLDNDFSGKIAAAGAARHLHQQLECTLRRTEIGIVEQIVGVEHTDQLHTNRVLSVVIIGVVGGVIALCIQPWTSQWMDVVSIYICPLGALLAGIMFFWVYGKNYVEEQVNLGRDKKFTDKYVPVCKYLYCPICILVLILGIALGGIG